MTPADTIWVFSDAKILASALDAVSLIMNSGAYKTLASIFVLFALVAVFFPAMFQFSSITKYWISILLLSAIISMPKQTITVVPMTNPVSGAVTVLNAPMFLTLPASIFTGAAKWMAEQSEQVMFTKFLLPDQLRTFAATGGPLGAEFRALRKFTNLAPRADIQSRLDRLYSKCVIPTAVILGNNYAGITAWTHDGKTTNGATIKSTCMAALKTTTAPAIVECLPRLNAVEAMAIVDSMPLLSELGTPTTCKAYRDATHTKLMAWANNHYTNEFLGFSSPSMKTAYTAALDQIKGTATTNAVYDYVASPATGKILALAIAKNANSTDGNSSLANSLALLTESKTGVIQGNSFMEYIPLIMDGLVAFMIMLFPMVVLSMVFGAAGGQMVSRLGNFYMAYISIAFIPTTLAVTNSFMLYFMFNDSDLMQAVTAVYASDIVSPMALMNLSSHLSAPESAMGYLIAAAPVITYALFTTGSIPVSQMLSGMMSGNKATSESAALNNYNADNTTAGNANIMTTDSQGMVASIQSRSDLQNYTQDVQTKTAGSHASGVASGYGIQEATGTTNIGGSYHDAHSASQQMESAAFRQTLNSIAGGNEFRQLASSAGWSPKQLASTLAQAEQFMDANGKISNFQGFQRFVSENLPGVDAGNLASAINTMAPVSEMEFENKKGAAQAVDAASAISHTTNQQRVFKSNLVSSLTGLGSDNAALDLHKGGYGLTEQGRNKLLGSVSRMQTEGIGFDRMRKNLHGQGYNDTQILDALSTVNQLGDRSKFSEGKEISGRVPTLGDQVGKGAAFDVGKHAQRGAIIGSAGDAVNQGRQAGNVDGAGALTETATGSQLAASFRDSAGNLDISRLKQFAQNASGSQIMQLYRDSSMGKYLGKNAPSAGSASGAKAAGALLGAMGISEQDLVNTETTAAVSQIMEQMAEQAGAGGSENYKQMKKAMGYAKARGELSSILVEGGASDDQRSVITHGAQAMPVLAKAVQSYNNSQMGSENPITSEMLNAVATGDVNSAAYQQFSEIAHNSGQASLSANFDAVDQGMQAWNEIGSAAASVSGDHAKTTQSLKNVSSMFGGAANFLLGSPASETTHVANSAYGGTTDEDPNHGTSLFGGLLGAVAGALAVSGIGAARGAVMKTGEGILAKRLPNAGKSATAAAQRNADARVASEGKTLAKGEHADVEDSDFPLLQQNVSTAASTIGRNVGDMVENISNKAKSVFGKKVDKAESVGETGSRTSNVDIPGGSGTRTENVEMTASEAGKTEIDIYQQSTNPKSSTMEDIVDQAKNLGADG